MTGRFGRAVVFGKFWPLHAGHLRLVDAARAGAEQVLVAVDAGAEDVALAVRLGWVREEFPSAEVVAAPDLCGHDSSACVEACSARYADWLLATHGPVDAVYSGEDYGAWLAACLGAASVQLDRRDLPASGREIRADLARHWALLSAPARASYCRRVAVVGAESTGTTTLAGDLAARLGTQCVPEYGRLFTEEHGIDHEWVTEDFDLIARMQARLEDEAARRSGPVLVCDTDVLATAIWHERYVGCRSPSVEASAATRKPHLYVLTSDDVAFVQDGMRDGEHLRRWMTERFRAVLELSGVPWIEVRGDRQRRLERVTAEIEHRFGALARVL